MADKGHNFADGLTAANAELTDITEVQHEKIRLEEFLLHSVNELNKISQRISAIPIEIDADKASMMEGIEMMEYLKKKNAEELEHLTKRNEEAARKEASVLNAQQSEYKRKVNELDGIHKECEYLQNVLKQKKAKVDDLQDQMDGETSLFVKQTVALSNLRSKPKFDSAKFADQQKVLQSASTQLNEGFRTAETQIEKLRKGNVAMGEALGTVQADNKLKTAELAALRYRAAVIKEQYEREQEKQNQILSDFRTVEEQRNVEISRMERELTEQRTAYANLKQFDADLTDRIASEFGNDKSLEEMKKDAKAELNGLQDDWSRLTESVDVIAELMNSNEIKLQLLREARHEQLRFESSTQQQDVQVAEEEQMDDSDDSEEEEKELLQPMDESDEDDQAFLVESPPRSPQREVEKNLDQPIVRSPDSSISDWMESSEEPEEGANNSTDDYHRRLRLFADKIFFGK
ncbi:kinesin heavy chain-like [Bradysia coprophila]|uniref:kinesin heavy chain-like n=1 Tax=Bradysia coprophila TaxID=38358 RepID=UPI00187DD210|nr:kinesin heavy chain-like [Bradysia coprophila]